MAASTARFSPNPSQHAAARRAWRYRITKKIPKPKKANSTQRYITKRGLTVFIRGSSSVLSLPGSMSIAYTCLIRCFSLLSYTVYPTATCTNPTTNNGIAPHCKNPNSGRYRNKLTAGSRLGQRIKKSGYLLFCQEIFFNLRYGAHGMA